MKNNIGPDASSNAPDEQTVEEAQALVRAVQERVNARTREGVKMCETRAFMHEIVDFVVDEVDAYAERKGLDRRTRAYGNLCATLMENVLAALTRDPFEELMETLSKKYGFDVTCIKTSKTSDE